MREGQLRVCTEPRVGEYGCHYYWYKIHVSTASLHTQKKVAKTQALFHFYFILTHIPLFKNLSLGAVCRDSGGLLFRFPSCLSPHLLPLGAPPPFAIIALCPPPPPQPPVRLGAPPGWSHSLRGLRGRPWGHKCLPGRMTKMGSVALIICRPDTAHGLSGTLRGSCPPICTICTSSQGVQGVRAASGALHCCRMPWGNA